MNGRHPSADFSAKGLAQPLVIIIDDHEDSLILAVHILESQQYRCLSAKNAAEGFALLKTSKPDAILLDIMLPDMSGFEVIHRVRQNFQLNKTPIIAATALASFQDQEQILEAGFTDYLIKPFRLDELIKKVQYHLKKTRFNL